VSHERTLRTVAGYAAGVSLALLCFHSEARAHGCTTASPGRESPPTFSRCLFLGLSWKQRQRRHARQRQHGRGWYAALVDRVPVNSAASGVGKLRVDPKRAWNSYLLDKLTGDLKFGEGNPMPNSSTGYLFQCPGGVEKIRPGILAGAPPAAPWTAIPRRTLRWSSVT